MGSKAPAPQACAPEAFVLQANALRVGGDGTDLPVKKEEDNPAAEMGPTAQAGNVKCEPADIGVSPQRVASSFHQFARLLSGAY